MNLTGFFCSREGTYSSGKDIVYIKGFVNKILVVESKQWPRRLSIKGSDGADYKYLLKGMSLAVTKQMC